MSLEPKQKCQKIFKAYFKEGTKGYGVLDWNQASFYFSYFSPIWGDQRIRLICWWVFSKESSSHNPPLGSETCQDPFNQSRWPPHLEGPLEWLHQGSDCIMLSFLYPGVIRKWVIAILYARLLRTVSHSFQHLWTTSTVRSLSWTNVQSMFLLGLLKLLPILG